MTGLRNLLRRWEIDRYESHRNHLEASSMRAEVMLGAYGLTASGAPRASSTHSY
jgi:hypothetical protein